MGGFTNHLWNADTEKVEIANARKLKEELLWDKIPDGVARCPHIVGDVGVAATGVDEGLVVLNGQGDGATVLGGQDMFLPQEKPYDCLSIEGESGILDAALQRCLAGTIGCDVARSRAHGAVRCPLLCRGEIAVGHGDGQR